MAREPAHLRRDPVEPGTEDGHVAVVPPVAAGGVLLAVRHHDLQEAVLPVLLPDMAQVVQGLQGGLDKGRGAVVDPVQTAHGRQMLHVHVPDQVLHPVIEGIETDPGLMAEAVRFGLQAGHELVHDTNELALVRTHGTRTVDDQRDVIHLVLNPVGGHVSAPSPKLPE